MRKYQFALGRAALNKPKETHMARRRLSAIVAAAVIAFTTAVLAQGQFGTAAEAKAMLEKPLSRS